MPDHPSQSFISPRIRKSPDGSLGVKLIIVCALVLLMSIPAMFISYISYERSNRADEVTREVSQRYGGEQYISGPILVAPYVQTDVRGRIAESGNYVVFADKGYAAFSDIETSIRKRSLFKVPTYQGDGTLIGQFDKVPEKIPEAGMSIDWNRAKIVVALSDVRGLKKDIEMTLPNGAVRTFEPANFDSSVNLFKGKNGTEQAIITSKNYQAYGWMSQSQPQTYLSVPAFDLVEKGQPFSVKVNMSLGGAKRLGVTPFAQSTTLRRGIRGQDKAHRLGALTGTDKIMTVQLVSMDNPYQIVNRALKYAVMFIGLVFIAYFLFEVIVGVRVHPAQYILIGLAQSIFYLLLLAFAERIGFTGAFFISAGATIAATAGYAGAVFGHRKYIARAGFVFTLVYGLLYTLMRMQDFALMIGAIASFMAIAGTMYLTRNMDWYGIKGAVQPS